MAVADRAAAGCPHDVATMTSCYGGCLKSHAVADIAAEFADDLVESPF